MTSCTAALPSPGSSAPLGASVSEGGVNFSLYARRATAVELCLFARVDDAVPSQRLRLDPDRHRTGDYWHCRLEGIGPGQPYGWSVEGPRLPQLGLRFDPANLLLDPHGLALAMPPGYGRAPGRSSSGDWGTAMKSVVADPHAYDWEGDRPLHRPSRETVIYELHVRGFTAHPSADLPPEQAGTYRGLISKIPYLQDLGITAVELLPVFAFDPLAAPAGLLNYWGYQPVSFFAPHPGYACSTDPLAVIDEFRDLVKALHRAGIEVILDVVFNHTAEGDAEGPAFCFRGLADGDYYLQNGDGTYIDVTGCGNTFNANHPVVRRLIRESLRHWVQHLHVDGFRFDLASVLDRDQTGRPTPLSPVLWDIDTDPVLAGTKLIAEAWDAAGLYQVGSFVGDNWQEWNGRFRDDVRRFIKGDGGLAASVGQRLMGSPDIYGHKQREAEASVNFITCHDGFTLADLVSYNAKHNGANGEGNRDGSDDNASWNCGIEGDTSDAEVLALRARQSRNLLTMLLLAVGTPMLAMGDELGRSQQGNNNAYAQDNPISWLDWSLLGRNADLHRFVRELLAYRQRRDVVINARNLSLGELVRRHHVRWHGVEPDQPDWSESSRSFATTITSVDHRFRWHAMVNAWWEPLRFRLPAAEGDQPSWRRWIDTSRPSPEDIVPWISAPSLEADTYTLGPRSIVVLVVGLSSAAAAGDGHPDPPAAGPDQPRTTPPDPPA
ncbi:glycogen debranching protein GlgX [Synechococcus sp. BO 8801]|uniref:glycogen debranching protein GlgX n=1 Tax=Synechococcus sp. BO 8801 TaxID=169670 RepID=UPI000B994911|nr:glycogen debranching protein GlgX [Synechococcus sp. BO 8801]